MSELDVLQPRAGCPICVHEERAEIEKGASAPRSIRRVASQFRLNRTTLTRHMDRHVQKEVADLPKELSLDQIRALKAQAQKIVDETDDDKVRIAALRELRGYLEFEARLQQESGGSSSLTTQPAFQQLAAVLARVLCPECRVQIALQTDNAIGTAISHAKAEEPGTGGIPATE